MTDYRRHDHGQAAGAGCRGGVSAVMRSFTLLEIVVAVAVFLLVALTMIAFSREMTRSWDKLRGEHERFHALLALDRAVDGMLSNAVPFSWRNEEGESEPFFVGESDSLRLASLHPVTHLEDGGLRFTEVFLEDDRLVAFYTQRPYLDPAMADSTAQVSVLARGVDWIEFLYADWLGAEAGDWPNRMVWLDRWDPERQAFPLAIMLTVHWEDGRVESWLRRTAGAGYRERWGKWEPPKSR